MLGSIKPVVTEDDLRQPEFKGKKVEDYEFDPSGAIARKDRFHTGMKAIADELRLNKANGWTCEDAVRGVEILADMLQDMINEGPLPRIMEKAVDELGKIGSEDWEKAE